MDQQRLELLKAVGKNMSLQKEMEGNGISKCRVYRYGDVFPDVSKVCAVCLATAQERMSRMRKAN